MQPQQAQSGLHDAGLPASSPVDPTHTTAALEGLYVLGWSPALTLWAACAHRSITPKPWNPASCSSWLKPPSCHLARRKAWQSPASEGASRAG